MINLDNSFFFDKKGFDFNNHEQFVKNLDKTKEISDQLLKEYDAGENEVIESFTKKYQSKIRKLKHEIDIKNKKKVVIGLGGSSSGAKALSFYIDGEIIFFDNLDYEYFINFFKKKNFKDYIYFVISKSGDTFETLAILNILIKEYKDNNLSNYLFESMVIITENKDSILNKFAIKNKIKCIEHNPNIGGRFSILSETGILPFLDLDLKVEEGSEKYIALLNEDNDQSPTRNVAILVTLIKEMKLSIYCNLIYNYRLKHFSYWFHQLHAESLGKQNLGMTPITSICPKDHHSMMQLYLDGPNNKMFNIFSPQDESYIDHFIDEGFTNIEHLTPLELLKKQFNSVIEVYKEKKIPHRVIKISDHRNPLNLIELFSYFILETILLGKVMGINPYDQPSVQLIKNKILKG